MNKKECQFVHIRLPKIWIKIMDENAHRQFITRTQLVKNVLKNYCLRSDKR